MAELVVALNTAKETIKQLEEKQNKTEDLL